MRGIVRSQGSYFQLSAVDFERASKQVEELLLYVYAKKSEVDPAAIQCTRMKAMSRIAFPRR
jgi:hypothetical protein